MTQPWIVALISTDYDLKDERKAIIRILKKNKIEVSAFEEPDFPVIQKTHSHDNCLKILNRVDAAILLINRRYGGEYYLDNNVSITEQEYMTLEVPTVVLINQQVWNERAVFNKQLKASNMEFEAFLKTGTYVPVYVDDMRVFRFINNIQNVFYSKGRSNWIYFWSDLDDLENKIPLVMQALSVTWVNKILDGQIKDVKARKTSTAFSMSLEEVLTKGYYIEPNVDVTFDSEKTGITLSEKANDTLLNNNSCLVLGEAGAGKTTLMAKCFLEMVETLKENDFYIPVYIRMKGKSVNYSFTVEEYLREGCEKYLHRDYYPFFKINYFKFTFFIDGFDELTEKLTKDDLQQLYLSEIFKWPVLLTSRSQFAEKYLSSNDFTSKFIYVIKLSEWTEDKAQKYINQFCVLQGKDRDFKERIKTLLVENIDLNEILKSPLLITILLYVIEHSRIKAPESITSRVHLFEECLALLAGREIESKIPKVNPIPENTTLILQWAYFAWMIYEKRLEGYPNVIISEALDTIKLILKNSNDVGWPISVYDVVFETNGELAFGAFHEQFLEFLVAYCLVYACLNKTKPYPDFLKYVIRPEINRYFRGIVNRKAIAEQQIIFDNIKNTYWECAGSTNDTDVFVRVHAVYHLTRLQAEDAHEQIERIFNSENNQAVLQSLYFGVIKKGNMRRENELFDLLLNKPSYNDGNRGYHLAYYDNIGTQKTIPYNDDISIVWSGTLQAFKRHFESTNKEHYYLRRIDLVTMWQFMEYRKSVEPLTDEDISFFEKRVHVKFSVEDDNYQKLVEKEFEKFKRMYYKIREKKTDE